MSEPLDRRSACRPHCAPAGRRPTRLGLEQLEDRCVPAVYNVTGLADGLGAVTMTSPGVFNAATLRAAIQAANANHDTSNTINLTAAGTYKITLAGTPGETDNAAGEFAIQANGANLTIQNTSGGRVVVDGNHLNRVFDINPANTNNPATKTLVTFQGFTIQNGFATDAANPDGLNASGGGIRDQGNASLTLNNVIVTNNSATADGGGVVFENTVSTPWTFTANNSVLSNNHAGDAGGGLDADGSGKIFINACTVITGNTSVNQGAGIWLDAIQAGAVLQTADLTVTGAVISNNSALAADNFGGGIGNAGNGAVTVANSLIENNFSGGQGGGFGDENGQGTLTVVNSLFLHNTAVLQGGGVQEGGPGTTIIGSIFEGNTSQGGDAAQSLGGALFVNGANVTVTDVLFRDNAAVSGGAVEDQATTLTVTSSTFDNNSTLGLNGGGGGNGGAIDAETLAGTLNVSNSLFLNNAAVSGGAGLGGGAIFQVIGVLNITNSEFDGNATDGIGGAVNFSANHANIVGSTFANNQAAGFGGGALFITGVPGSPSAVTNSTFVGNRASNGGAIMTGASGPVSFLNDTINGNTATKQGGGIDILSGKGPFVFQNTLIAQNAGPTGPDVFNGSGTAVADNGGNVLGTTVSGFGAGTPVVANPLLGRLEDNGGPLVGGPSDRRHIFTEALLPGSTAIGAGVSSGAPATDERGFNRPTNLSAGAYEPQYTLGTSPNQVFIESLYEALLHRTADAGAAGWATQLDRGASRAAVVQALENSLEYRTDVVQSLYQRFLHRAADAGGLQASVNFLAAGGTVEQLEAILVGSDEYFQLHGGTVDGFEVGLFEDGLNRAHDANGQAGFSLELAGGLSRSAVAAQVFASQEFLQDLILSDYQALLGRPADAGGLQGWVGGLQGGMTDQALLAALLGSQESFTVRS